MLHPDKLRRMEVLRQDGSWEGVSDMGRLEVGDVFRMFEPCGDRCADPAGFDTWTVTEPPVIRCIASPIQGGHMMSPVQDGGR